MEITQTVPRISLKAARVNAGYTLVAAAQRLGINKDTLANYENYRTIPDWEIVDKIGKLYQYPTSLIRFRPDYGLTENPSPPTD